MPRKRARKTKQPQSARKPKDGLPLDPNEPNGPPALKADEPMVDQLERWAEEAPDQKEFDRRSEWLQKNAYQNPEFMSMQTSIRPDSTTTSDSQ